MAISDRIAVLALALALAMACSVAACKKRTEGGTEAPAVASPSGAPAPDKGPPAPPIGMENPFARLGAEAARSLDAGYKALRAKKYDEARAAFAAVVQAAPDATAGRFQEVRAAALGGHPEEVPGLWRELLGRDYIAYRGRLAVGKELAPLRASPAWGEIQQLEASLRTAYAAGLDRGVFFVARSRDAASPTFDASGQAKLSPNQEVYHYEPASGRYRRLTETGGRVWALAVSPDRKQLTFLVTPKLGREPGTGKTIFLEPQGGVIDLMTLETVGPLGVAPSARAVRLAFSGAGEPLWVIDGQGYTLDATRTAMVEVASAPGDALEPHSTLAEPGAVTHFGAATAGAQLSEDGRALTIEGSDKPLRAARAIAAGSIEWSPGRKRLVYAGVLDACKALQAPPGAAGDKNELFLWDTEKKLAVRLAAAVSQFETHWLDDDHLVYEGGVGKEGKLHLYEVSTRKDALLAPRSGAGLYGYPSLSCIVETPAAAEAEAPSAEEGAAEPAAGDVGAGAGAPGGAGGP